VFYEDDDENDKCVDYDDDDENDKCVDYDENDKCVDYDDDDEKVEDVDDVMILMVVTLILPYQITTHELILCMKTIITVTTITVTIITVSIIAVTTIIDRKPQSCISQPLQRIPYSVLSFSQL